jgi:hypothetical protein
VVDGVPVSVRASATLVAPAGVSHPPHTALATATGEHNASPNDRLPTVAPPLMDLDR